MKNKKRRPFGRSLEEIKDKLKTSSKKEIQYDLDHHADQDWKNKEEQMLNTPVLHLDNPDHKMPQTRREFLASGIISTAVSVALPSFIPSAAKAAASCGGGDGVKKQLPIVIIEAAGGSSLIGDNATVGANSPDELLDDYKRFGVPNADRTNIFSPFGGNSMKFHSFSMFAAGIIEGAGNDPEVLSKMDGSVVASVSMNDTANNELNISSILQQAGLAGSILGAVGNYNSASGGRSKGVSQDLSNRSVYIRNEADVLALMDSASLKSTFRGSQESVDHVLRSISSITDKFLSGMKTGVLTREQKNALYCNTEKSKKILSSGKLEIYKSNIAMKAFPTGPKGGVENAIATASYLALQGISGAATVTIGGCDYHTGNRAAQDVKDKELGRSIGQCLKMAKEANSPMMVYIYSDGATFADEKAPDGARGFYSPKGDSGAYASLQMFFYDPKGRPQINKRQLGTYGPKGIDPKATPWASSVPVAAKVIAYNYLKASNQLNKVSMLGDLGFNPADVDCLAAPIMNKG